MALNIAVACGGTGGHVMPGLATAEVFRARGHQVTLWLTGKKVEDESVSVWDGPLVRVPAQGFPTRFSPEGVRAAWTLMRAVAQCTVKMRSGRPDVLLAMGSYASAGPVLAARLLRVPVVLHEANVIPGRAVRLLARGARAVACHFEETRFHLPKRPVQITGMPLRTELTSRSGEASVQRDRFTVLVMGGSAGAHALNEMATEALGALAAKAKGRMLAVLHLAGRADEEWVRERYAETGVPAKVLAFTRDMAPLYLSADLAICRAGASTCAELALFGVPALLVPYPFAANDHQMANARALEKAGAADVVPESGLSASWLIDYIDASLGNPGRLARMREAMKARRPAQGAERLAELVEHCAAPLSTDVSETRDG